MAIAEGRSEAAAARAAKAVAWRERICQWQRGGLSQAAFCRQQGLALATFQYWRKRLRSPGDGPMRQRRVTGAVAARARGRAFVPVHIKAASVAVARPSSVGSWACEVSGAGGIRVRLRERPSLARLQKLVTVLAGAMR